MRQGRLGGDFWEDEKSNSPNKLDSTGLGDIVSTSQPE